MGHKHSRGRAKTLLHPAMHQGRTKGPEQILSTVLQTSGEMETGTELGKKFLLQFISICIFSASGELTLSFNEEMYVGPPTHTHISV